MQLGRKPYANPNDAIPEHLRKQLPYAVGKANDYLMSCAERLSDCEAARWSSWSWGSPDSVDTDQGFTGVIVRAAMNACS